MGSSDCPKLVLAKFNLKALDIEKNLPMAMWDALTGTATLGALSSVKRTVPHKAMAQPSHTFLLGLSPAARAKVGVSRAVTCSAAKDMHFMHTPKHRNSGVLLLLLTEACG